MASELSNKEMQLTRPVQIAASQLNLQVLCGPGGVSHGATGETMASSCGESQVDPQPKC